jgi:hypothetical protein
VFLPLHAKVQVKLNDKSVGKISILADC